ncbi:MAG: riboflavin biosynthesis protein RibF [Prevotellaceae bacterium]|jgi:riboflavin kinase/FMN adenylyltransferase|nr:riboflavin biosynthesis protein RibF [Prevotellaceae bacterium]
MKEIKNLIIDFGGVLIDLDRKRCIEKFRQIGFDHVEQMLDVCHQQGFFLEHEKGLISDAEFRDRIRDMATRPVTDEQIDEAWNSFLLTIPAYKLRLLLRLKKHYNVILLSNTNGIHWDYSRQHVFNYRGHTVEDFFHHLFVSYEMHLAKPDPAIFRRVIDETGIRPEETLFLDDSPANCRAAESLGIRTYTPSAHEDWSHLFPEAAVPRVATIGFFDGVHQGHRFLLRLVMEAADALGWDSAVVTFPVHPRKVLELDYRPKLLTTRDERYRMIEEVGIDHCISLDFTPQVAALSARYFMMLLREEYNIRSLVVGYDHRFGFNRSEGIEEYLLYGHELKMGILPATPHKNDRGNDVVVSSSLIRQLLLEGDVRNAADYLTYHYFLQGTVVSGYQIGHRLGYPTANVSVDDPEKIVPADGVYAVLVTLDGQTRRGMLYIGTRPTFNNGPERSIEVNIFDFDADIYHHPIRLTFIDYVREDRKFDTPEELTAQLTRDREAVMRILQDTPPIEHT